MSEYMKQRYYERKQHAIQLLGGKCVVCDSTENLELDHINPTTKVFSISKMWSINEAAYLVELAKCQLLCNEHHKQKTSKEQGVEHGGGVSGKRNCPCSLCKAKKHEYYLMRY